MADAKWANAKWRAGGVSPLFGLRSGRGNQKSRWAGGVGARGVGAHGVGRSAESVGRRSEQGADAQWHLLW